MHTNLRLSSAFLITSWCLLAAGAETSLEAQEVAAPAAIVTANETAVAGIGVDPAAPPSLFSSTTAPMPDTPPQTTLVPPGRRRPVLTSLYAGFVATQALDVHSTLRALSAGHKEANPLMRWATSNPVALVGFKTAASAGTILLVERIRKKHPIRAMILMAAVDTAFAFVVAHNYSAPVPNR